MTASESTDPRRDVTVDALRALAIVGVALGHWLVTALERSPGGLVVRSPLEYLPELAPASWVLQTLALFFFAGGFAASASLDRHPRYAGWLRARIVPLLAPLAALGGFWLLFLGALRLGGLGDTSLRVLGGLAVSPLWFLGVYLVLTLAAPVLDRLARRCGPVAVLPALAVVALDDLALYGPGDPPDPAVAVLGAAAVLGGWLVPYQLGLAAGRGRLAGRGSAIGLAVAGALGAVGLLALAYPSSMVGISGADRSNLNPPSLLALALGAVQIGLFLLVRPAARRWLRSARAGRVATAVIGWFNRHAFAIFCWHQTSLLILLALVGPIARGLLGEPPTYGWLAHRLMWLPVLVGILAVLCRVEPTRARWATGGGRIRVLPDTASDHAARGFKT